MSYQPGFQNTIDPQEDDVEPDTGDSIMGMYPSPSVTVNIFDHAVYPTTNLVAVSGSSVSGHIKSTRKQYSPRLATLIILPLPLG
jgi:hypothetical protein